MPWVDSPTDAGYSYLADDPRGNASVTQISPTQWRWEAHENEHNLVIDRGGDWGLTRERETAKHEAETWLRQNSPIVSALSDAEIAYLMAAEEAPFDPIGWLYQSIYDGLAARRYVVKGMGGYRLTDAGRQELANFRARPR